jgi:hypothetical protein
MTDLRKKYKITAPVSPSKMRTAIMFKLATQLLIQENLTKKIK